jgi:predicted helicase
MAAKARLMANIIENTLEDKGINPLVDGNSLDGQLKGFREVLIHDITHKDFADIYAQTIAYGMFAAKLNDAFPNPSFGGETPPLQKERGLGGEVFTRSKAAQLIPHSNPFLRKLFQYIAGYDLDERIRWVVDDLADLFNCVDMDEITKEFDKVDHDPIIHFYETFLAEYDPALRKSRGVWYTPQPVVQFIVQAVDDILKQDFGISQGLADNSFLPSPFGEGQGVRSHRVQIFDPATGTATFLAAVVQNIYQHFKTQQGMWQSYVDKHLIPRINGFEILMASYAMAHLKLDMLLQQTGYQPSGNKRLRIYLTNSLEEARAKTEIPFAQWLSDEANEANHIKQDVPVMVVLGNPPYSGESQNSGEWIGRLMLDYKKEASGIKLQEKNSKWINDDYVKFIRFGQYFIKKNGEGILAFINNHSFLDNPTFRGMRYSLLKTFDKIYVLDLHGNAKKKETAPDGGKDENVFDIQQGVSINIFVKKRKENG